MHGESTVQRWVAKCPSKDTPSQRLHFMILITVCCFFMREVAGYILIWAVAKTYRDRASQLHSHTRSYKIIALCNLIRFKYCSQEDCVSHFWNTEPPPVHPSRISARPTPSVLPCFGPYFSGFWPVILSHSDWSSNLEVAESSVPAIPGGPILLSWAWGITLLTSTAYQEVGQVFLKRCRRKNYNWCPRIMKFFLPSLNLKKFKDFLTCLTM